MLFRDAFGFPVPTSHNVTSPPADWPFAPDFPLPVAMSWPSGLYASEMADPMSPLKEAFSCPVATSHRVTAVPSTLPSEARVLPSGLNAGAVCPLKEVFFVPVLTSQSVSSSPPTARVLPSRLRPEERRVGQL